MGKKQIKSRYEIEYVYPTPSSNASKKPSPGIVKKAFFAASFFGLIAIGYVASIFYTNNNSLVEINTNSTRSLANSITANKTIVTESAQRIIDELTQTGTEKIKEEIVVTTTIKPDNINNELLEKLDNITKQLLIEKKKNKELNSRINTNQNKNNALSLLLQEAISKANSSDKKYLNALAQFDKKKQEKKVKTRSTNEIAQLVNAEVAKLAPIEETKDVIDHKNTVQVANTTLNQMDAIIAAMQGGVVTHTPKAKITATTNKIDLNKSRKISHKPKLVKNFQEEESSEAELLHIRLQKQINDLLRTNELQTTDYKVALKKESIVRKNAVRSITVRKGDTLWGIARRAYGSGNDYRKIIKANPEVSRNGKIYLREGQIIHVPI